MPSIFCGSGSYDVTRRNIKNLSIGNLKNRLNPKSQNW